MQKTFYPVANTFQKIKTFLIPYTVILICALCIKIAFTKEDIYFFINGLHFHAGDIFFPYATEMGSTVTAFVLPLLLLFVSYRKSLLLGSSYLLTLLVNVPLKTLFEAPRPKLYFSAVARPIYYVPDVEVLSNHFSFPSGHTVCAFTAAVVLTYITPRKVYGFLYLFLALLVAYSRMYMSQHFFEDVTAGSFVAVSVTILWLSWFDKQAFLQKDFWQGSLSRKTA
ncbi:Membrane-associated phospholipid phosphatase [Chitinophaga sp. CF118]|uniref:phosphatase PAP2 family protein n=1 Tax=Chitinophaga sp. CF118 TaxID=1884367 RepID=UPI0008E09422|nr:phosphatase PAP2 family protein [Chitinophaga sp. CF118]SFD50351.1 Membrane-associated phospholipid phosphatase [Chitinophaga sp. CF118]